MSGSLGSTGSPVSTTATAPTKARNQTQVFVYDITLSAHIPDSELLVDHEVLKRLFKVHCKKWTFQLEKGEQTGYMHYQCRVSLKNKLRPDRARTIWSGYLPGCHITPTAGCNSNNVFYVSKEETRVQGPWSDNCEPAFVPWQYAEVLKWLPWQQSILDDCSTRPDKRKINVIVDLLGDVGKTTFSCWHACRGLAGYIPPLETYKEICQIVCDLPSRRVYFFDFPRGIDQRNTRGLFSGIEAMKAGHAFDPRIKYKEKWLDTPHIWVFMNECPAVWSLTLNRWVFWIIDHKTKNLINVTAETINAIKNKEVPYFGPRSLSLNIIEDPSLIPNGMPEEVRQGLTLQVIEEEVINSVESAPGLPHSVNNSVQPLPAQLPPHEINNEEEILNNIYLDFM